MENRDKKRILEMIKEGKISVDEGIELLNAINEEPPKVDTVMEKPVSKKKRKLRIAVLAEDGSDRADVNVSIPINLVKAVLPVLNSGIIPEKTRVEIGKNGIDMDAVMSAIDGIIENIDDLDEDMVNIDVGGEDTARVRIYVD